MVVYYPEMASDSTTICFELGDVKLELSPKKWEFGKNCHILYKKKQDSSVELQIRTLVSGATPADTPLAHSRSGGDKVTLLGGPPRIGKLIWDLRHTS